MCILIYTKKMHYYKCPKLNNRVKLNNYLFMLFLVSKLYILIIIVILFYLMLRKHLKNQKIKQFFSSNIE